MILLFFYKKHQEDDIKAGEISEDNMNGKTKIIPGTSNLENDISDKVNDDKLDDEADKGKEISV
ncbi:MAG: hypothetical protein P8X47_09910 [Ignavibacteriaceae bacterium]